MLIGGLGFAAFSVGIDYFMFHRCVLLFWSVSPLTQLSYTVKQAVILWTDYKLVLHAHDLCCNVG